MARWYFPVAGQPCPIVGFSAKTGTPREGTRPIKKG
jgi:hypothetical protein